MADPQKVVTGAVRLSYVHAFEPWTSNPEKNDPKYSVVILVPKKDKRTVEAIQAAQKAALEAGKDTVFKGRIPKGWTNTFHDGDEDADLEKNPEYAGHYYMTVSSWTRPGIVDRDVHPILDPTELYSGCYARVSMRAYPFNNSGNQGVSFGLNNIQKVREGEPFGNVARAEDDFDPLDDEDGDEDLL